MENLISNADKSTLPFLLTKDVDIAKGRAHNDKSRYHRRGSVL